MEIHKLSKLNLKRLFNTSGNIYKELKLSNGYEFLSDADRYELLSSDGMLVKRPILLLGNQALIGFKEEEWGKAL